MLLVLLDLLLATIVCGQSRCLKREVLCVSTRNLIVAGIERIATQVAPAVNPTEFLIVPTGSSVSLRIVHYVPFLSCHLWAPIDREFCLRIVVVLLLEDGVFFLRMVQFGIVKIVQDHRGTFHE